MSTNIQHSHRENLNEVKNKKDFAKEKIELFRTSVLAPNNASEFQHLENDNFTSF